MIISKIWNKCDHYPDSTVENKMLIYPIAYTRSSHSLVYKA